MEHTVMLNKNRDFVNLYKKGTKVGSKFVLCYVRPNGRAYNRLGLTAGKKVGNAVERNRAKRVLRAAYREAESCLPCGIDLILVALPGLPQEKSTTIAHFLMGNGARRIWRAVGQTPQNLQ